MGLVEAEAGKVGAGVVAEGVQAEVGVVHQLLTHPLLGGGAAKQRAAHRGWGRGRRVGKQHVRHASRQTAAATELQRRAVAGGEKGWDG